MTIGYTARIFITPRIVFDAMLLAVVTAFLAGIFPAWKASRMVITDAIRHGR
jgi:putative ABC transport system permease protein